MLSVSCALVDLALVSEFWRTKYLIWHFFRRECCCKCEIQSNDVAKKEQFTICTTIWSTINDPWISCQYITMSSLTWVPTSQSLDSEWAHEKLIERIFSNWVFHITIRFKKNDPILFVKLMITSWSRCSLCRVLLKFVDDDFVNDDRSPFDKRGTSKILPFDFMIIWKKKTPLKPFR